MNALVMSGGGSKGAFAGGIAEYLLRERRKKYDILIGTSTGSLMVPLLAIGEIEKLKRVYTSVTEEEIFSICPFIIRKEGGGHKVRVNYLGLVRMFLRGMKSFGDSRNLRKLISSVVTVEDFRRIQSSGKDIGITVSNLSCNRVEYKSVKNCSYDDFCDWMWISSNLVPFMSLVKKNGFEYADGGIGDLVPIREAIKRGATEIDAIVLSPNKFDCEPNDSGNAFSLTLKVFDFMLNQIRAQDIAIGKLEGLNRDVNINFYYTPRRLTRNSLLFDPEEMCGWWEEGFEHAKANPPMHSCLKAPVI